MPHVMSGCFRREAQERHHHPYAEAHLPAHDPLTEEQARMCSTASAVGHKAVPMRSTARSQTVVTRHEVGLLIFGALTDCGHSA